jgi:hypothetical protein
MAAVEHLAACRNPRRRRLSRIERYRHQCLEHLAIVSARSHLQVV